MSGASKDTLAYDSNTVAAQKKKKKKNTKDRSTFGFGVIPHQRRRRIIMKYRFKPVGKFFTSKTDDGSVTFERQPRGQTTRW